MAMRVTLFLVLFLFSFSTPSLAHFGMVIPSQSLMDDGTNDTVSLTLRFWHPFENRGMNLEKPSSVKVFYDGMAMELQDSLTEGKEQGMTIWKTSYAVKKPGVYSFVMEPKPYYEKEEDCFIQHLTKTYVTAFGDDDGWDAPLGLRAEIVPLVNPSTLYTGNVFRGLVMQGEEPVADALVEIEWYPGEQYKGRAPSPSMITQKVKTDSTGAFSYAAPASGWWGFAALLHDENTLLHEGKEKPIELGAVLWVEFHPMLPPEPLK